MSAQPTHYEEPHRCTCPHHADPKAVCPAPCCDICMFCGEGFTYGLEQHQQVCTLRDMMDRATD